MAVLLCVSAALYLLVLAVKVGLARAQVARWRPPAPRATFADATILQPILGGDPALAETLADNVRALRGAHFHWLLDEDDAIGREAAHRVVAAQPEALIVLQATPPVPEGVNPKLFKLALAEPAVNTPVLVVLDDDTRLSPSGLAAMLDGLATHDVVTGLPCYRAGRGLASHLVAQFVNNQSILTYLPMLRFHPPITLNGMAYALRTARLRELGGFAPLSRSLTDDLAVARLVLRAGGRIQQTPVPHTVATSVSGARHHRQLLHRWFVFALLLVRAQPRRWRAAILSLHGLPPVLLWLAIVAALIAGATAWWPWAVLAATLALRSGLIVAAQATVGGEFRHAPASSLLAELLQPLHLGHALLARRIRWRTRVIDVRADDDFSYR